MWRRTHTTNQITPKLEGKEVIINGWVHAIRTKGKIQFLVIRDADGMIQVTNLKNKQPELFDEINNLTRESVIAIKGVVKLHSEAPNGVEINPQQLWVLNRAETPLPFDPYADYIDTKKDTRFDWRILDLRNEKSLAYHKLRSWMIYAVMNYMYKEGFTYWTTPKVLGQSSEGGADVFPVNWFGKSAYLAMSPQLHKQAIAGNTGTKFFEFTPYFRAEKSRTRRHLAEFSGFDGEIPFSTEEDVWSVLEGILSVAAKELSKHKKELEIVGAKIHKFKTPFKRISYDECVDLINSSNLSEKMKWGDDFSTEQEAKLWEIIKEPFFIYHWPKTVAKFYVHSVEDESIKNFDKKAHAFDLIYKIELSSGAWREHRYEKLVENLHAKNLNPNDFESYLDFFRYGCAPHAGFGLGVERLLATLTDAEDLREVVAFPRTVDRLAP